MIVAVPGTKHTSFTTVITGVAGVVLGAAVPLPAALGHPSTVAVTVYAPALFPVILAVVSFVLLKN